MASRLWTVTACSADCWEPASRSGAVRLGPFRSPPNSHAPKNLSRPHPSAEGEQPSPAIVCRAFAGRWEGAAETRLPDPSHPPAAARRRWTCQDLTVSPVVGSECKVICARNRCCGGPGGLRCRTRRSPQVTPGHPQVTDRIASQPLKGRCCRLALTPVLREDDHCCHCAGHRRVTQGSRWATQRHIRSDVVTMSAAVTDARPARGRCHCCRLALTPVLREDDATAAIALGTAG